jgi:hypothetical protein
MLVDERPEWQARAACRGMLPLFFPQDAEGNPRLHTAAEEWLVWDTCAKCPVFDECAIAGIGEEHGVWAGDIRPLQGVG